MIESVVSTSTVLAEISILESSAPTVLVKAILACLLTPVPSELSVTSLIEGDITLELVVAFSTRFPVSRVMDDPVSVVFISALPSDSKCRVPSESSLMSCGATVILVEPTFA